MILVYFTSIFFKELTSHQKKQAKNEEDRFTFRYTLFY